MANGEPYPIEWIDAYVARLRGFVVVREEDSLLIKVPNEAHKLNPSGVRILKRLFGGERVTELWQSYGGTSEVRRDLYHFFTGLKQVLQGCLDENCLPDAVVSKPFTLGFNTLPVLSEVALTYRCNLRCRFCYAGCSCTRRSDVEGEMSFHDVCRVLRAIRDEAQVPSVSFTGGEPTLREDLPELVRFARETLGLRVNLITNGTRVTSELARAVADAGLASAQVSLESSLEAEHDALTQVPGSYLRTLDGLQHLRDTGIRVHTNTTLNRLNRESAAAIPGFVRGLGLERFSMNLVIPAGSGRTDGVDINLRYEDVGELVLAVRDAATSAGVEFMWYSPTPVCMFNPIPHRLGNKGCAACDGLLSVSPAGDVLPCSSWPEPVGHILRDGFRPVWDSARAQALRRKEDAPPGCRACEDFALCQGGCPLYWNHFGCEELERFGGCHAAATA